jgi:hypothetical protein
MFHDTYTSAPITGGYFLVTDKKMQTYYSMFQILKNHLTNYGKCEYAIKSITLDFETGLRESWTQNFNGSRVIGCLFHLKSAMYRKISGSKIPKSLHTELVNELTKICWEKVFDKAIIDNIQKKYEKNVEQNKFVQYFRDTWEDLIKTGIINYAVIEQKYRSNSIIEGYQLRIEKIIPSKANASKVLLHLKSELSYH